VQGSHDVGDLEDTADDSARLVDEVDERFAVVLDGLACGPNEVPHSRPLDLDTSWDVATSVSISDSMAARRALESLTNSSKRFRVALVGTPPLFSRSCLHLVLMSIAMDASLVSKAAKSPSSLESGGVSAAAIFRTDTNGTVDAWSP
jgi:hypothetical protein